MIEDKYGIRLIDSRSTDFTGSSPRPSRRVHGMALAVTGIPDIRCREFWDDDTGFRTANDSSGVAVGAPVTIAGANFNPAPDKVPQVTMNQQDGGVMAVPMASFDDTSIMVTVPAGADTTARFSVSFGENRRSESVNQRPRCAQNRHP